MIYKTLSLAERRERVVHHSISQLSWCWSFWVSDTWARYSWSAASAKRGDSKPSSSDNFVDKWATSPSRCRWILIFTTRSSRSRGRCLWLMADKQPTWCNLCMVVTQRDHTKRRSSAKNPCSEQTPEMRVRYLQTFTYRDLPRVRTRWESSTPRPKRRTDRKSSTTDRILTRKKVNFW